MSDVTRSPDPERIELESRAAAGNVDAASGIRLLDAAADLVEKTSTAVSDALAIAAATPIVRPSAAEVARRRPPSAEPKPADQPAPMVTIVATAGKATIGEAHDVLHRVLGDGIHSGRPLELGKEYVYTQHLTGLRKLGHDPGENRSILEDAYQATQEARQKETALVAAFCSPSEPRYSFVNVADGNAGTIGLPQVEAPRGRVTFTPAATVDSLRNTAGIGTHWAGASKSTYHLTCETNVTVELGATYTSIDFPNEIALFAPEQLAHVEATAAAIHQQNVSALLISQIQTAADDFGSVGTGGGSTIEVLRNLTYFAGWLRARYAASESTILEVGLPYWVKDSLEADYIARPGTTEVGIGTAGWTQRLRRGAGVNVQWLYGLDADLSSPAPPGSTSALMWFAGSIVWLRGRDIDTGIYRDQILNTANKAAIFRESWNAALFQGPEPVEILIPICGDGSVGQQVDIVCEVS